MTNYENVKKMSIDEMAKFIARIQINEGINKDVPSDFQTVENIARGQKQWLETELI